MSLEIIPPQQIFYDKEGRPLDAGFIFVGAVNQNPETSAVPVYWDAALTQPAPQPIRTINGYPARQGIAARIYTNAAFSMTIRTKTGQLVLTAKNGLSNGDGFGLLVFPDYTTALAASATLPSGQRVDDEGSQVSYVVQGGTLVKIADFPSKYFVSGNAAALQAALDDVSNLQVKLEPGEYDFDGSTFTIQSKNHIIIKGEYLVDFTGVRFNGTGRIILDSCKRVRIKGLYAPDWDIEYRGVWWTVLEECQYRRQILGRAGVGFNPNYWDSWINCVTQSILIPGDATSLCNDLIWINPSMRGNTGQGFVQTSDYAIEFLGNVDAQSWKIIGGDISYHTIDIYRVGSGNVDGDIELMFDGVYFDTFYPKPLSRLKSRLQTKNCHSANNFPGAALMSAVARGGQDAFRQDRACAWAQSTATNMIPNGDLRVGMTTYTGAGRPIGATGGATITEVAGVGQSGRALRITQPGTSGTTLIRSKPLAYLGRHTGGLIIRNADSGTRTMRVSFAGLFEVITIRSSEWTYWTLTTGADLAVGSQPDIQVLTNDATPFNVDIAYMGVTFGEGGPAMLTSPPLPQLLAASASFFNPPSIAPGGSTTTVIDAPGAVLGDFVTPSFGISLNGISLSAYVSADNFVTVVFANNTAGAIDLASGMVRALITKPTF